MRFGGLRRGLREVRRKGPVVEESHLFAPRALDLRKGLVQDIARIRKSEELPFSDESARQNRQHVVASVSAHNPVGLHSVNGGGGFTERLACGVRITRQALVRDRADRVVRLLRRAIWILVGVELDGLALFRLLAGDVSPHRLNIWSNERHSIPHKTRKTKTLDWESYRQHNGKQEQITRAQPENTH